MRRLLLPLFLVAGALLSACSVHLGSHYSASPTASLSLHQANAVVGHSTVAQVVKKVLPSVVNIRVTQFGVGGGLLGGPQTGKAEGSGVIISHDGTILTNNHVIAGAVKVTVVFNDGVHSTPMQGHVLGADSTHDLAVVKVSADDLKPITIGRSQRLELGDEVIALGFPLGLGGPTVTKGIVSGVNRKITVSRDTGGTEHLVGLLQTDAAINPGNSGGALVNAGGQLVGINTAAAQAGSAENVGFAISIDHALPVVRQILSQPVQRRAWLGVSVSDLDPSIAQQLGLDPSATGAVVAGVIPGSPASSAGIQTGDVIVEIAGHAIGSADELTSELTDLKPGQRITVKVIGSNGSRTIQVTLANRPATFQPNG